MNNDDNNAIIMLKRLKISILVIMMNMKMDNIHNDGYDGHDGNNERNINNSDKYKDNGQGNNDT